MNCKFCQSLQTAKYGIRRDIQYYVCRTCRRTFSGRIAPEGMRFSTATIGKSLGLFYAGSSLAAISRHFLVTEGIKIDPATVWRWVIKYSKLGEKIMNQAKIKTSWRWVINETMIRIAETNVRILDIVDSKSGFLLATHPTLTHNKHSAMAILLEARSHAIGNPEEIVSSGLRVFPAAIERVFGSQIIHIRAKGSATEINTNITERFQATVKERTKVIHRLKTMESAKIISQGFIINYNFLQPYITTASKVPSVVAGLQLPFRTWLELINYLSKNV